MKDERWKTVFAIYLAMLISAVIAATVAMAILPVPK